MAAPDLDALFARLASAIDAVHRAELDVLGALRATYGTNTVPLAAALLDGLPDKHTLTIEETAHALGIGRSSAYEAARRGELPAVKVGRRWLVPRAALAEYLRGR